MIALCPPGLLGTIVYETRIVLRRKAIWLSLLPLTGLVALLSLISPATSSTDPIARIGSASIVMSIFYTVGIAVALADRLTRHRHAGLTDLFEATPSSATAMMVGTILGPLAIALIPPGVILVLLGTVTSIDSGTSTPISAAAIGFLTVVVPGALVLTSLVTLLGRLLPLAAARVLAVGVWFWATVVSPTMLPVPTVTGTVLSPLGGYPAAAWLHTTQTWANRHLDGPLHPAADTGTATLNIVLMLGLTVLFFGASRAIGARRG